MNDNFNRVFDRAGLSMYALSQLSGVPYTTINEIRNGVNDINRCSAGTVWRLGAALGADPGELINRIRFLEGVKGRAGKVDYVWHSDDTSRLCFEYDGENVELDTDRLYDIPARVRYYREIARWMIGDYIEQKSWDAEAEKYMKQRPCGEYRDE